MMLSERPTIKGHVLYDSDYRNCPREENPHREKADEQLPGQGREACGATAAGYRVSSGDGENVPELDSDEGRTALPTSYMPLMVNFMYVISPQLKKPQKADDLVVTVYCCFARHHHWGDRVKGTQTSILTNVCESAVISIQISIKKKEAGSLKFWSFHIQNFTKMKKRKEKWCNFKNGVNKEFTI